MPLCKAENIIQSPVFNHGWTALFINFAVRMCKYQGVLKNIILPLINT